MACACRSSVWKVGLSIDNLTRQQIWEENFRTRETLRGVQRSEHFWDFQTMNETAECNCLAPRKSLQKCKSLQALNKVGQCLNNGAHMAPPVQQPVHHCRRDVGTVTTPPRVDKSVGPGPRRVRLPAPPQRPFIAGSVSSCPRYRPPEWMRNDDDVLRRQRQESLQKLRKSEEALQQVMRAKRVAGNTGRWGTEYTRSYKDSGLGRPPGYVTPRPSTPSQRPLGWETPAFTRRRTGTPSCGMGRDTPLPGSRKLTRVT